MKKTIALVMAFFVALSALYPTLSHASFSPENWYVNGASSPSGNSAADACNKYLIATKQSDPNTTSYAVAVIGSAVVGGAATYCRLTATGYSADNQVIGNMLTTCPANSTMASGQCTCSAGYDEVSKSCVASVCGAKTGQSVTVNFTEGYTRSTDENDRAAMIRDTVGQVNRPPANGEFCLAGCKVVAETSGPNVQPYVSSTPTANGLYRRSIDMPAQQLGVACSAGTGASTDQQINPLEAPPTCPGFVGTVNGKTVCAGTAAKPVFTTDIGRNATPAVAGNPAAGEKPATGEGSGSTGSGRTPAAGTGGNTGGPSAAAVGTGGTGTVATPATGQEQANCGAPGQPKCRIDESGTTDGKTAFDASKTELDQVKTDIGSAISGAQNIQTPAWSFSFQLPTGCTPYNTGIKGVIMNPCAYQSMIHDLMSMIWAAVTAMCLIGMVGRTIRES